MHTPFFSVIVPVYNKEKYINNCLNSIIKQEYGNYELIIVCDPSTDNSKKEVEKFSDPRIRVLYRNKPGPGGYAARNLGIKEAKAEWITFLDADDEWLPGHLKNMHELTLKFSNVYFLSSGWILMHNNKKVHDDYYMNFNSLGPHIIDLDNYLYHSTKNRRPVWTGTACFNKNKLNSDTYFPEDRNIQRGGDIYLWLKIIINTKKMAWSNHIGAIYNIEINNSVTKTASYDFKLLNKNVYNKFSSDLNKKQKKLLKKHFNYLIKNTDRKSVV